jgi:hypothetical protein
LGECGAGGTNKRALYAPAAPDDPMSLLAIQQLRNIPGFLASKFILRRAFISTVAIPPAAVTRAIVISSRRAP